MGKLNLDLEQIRSCRESAARIAQAVMGFAQRRSTVSIERAILRLLGVAGADETEVPYVNRLVTCLVEKGWLQDGVAIHVGHAAVTNKMSLEETLHGLVEGDLTFSSLRGEEIAPARRFIEDACARRWNAIEDRLAERDAPAARWASAQGHWLMCLQLRAMSTRMCATPKRSHSMGATSWR